MSTARRGPTSRTSRIVSASSSLNQHATASGRMDPPPPPGSSRIARPASALSLNSSQSGRGGVDEELSSVAPAERGPRKAKAAVGGTASSSKSGASKKEDGEGGDVNIEVVLRCRGRSSKEIAENSPIIVSTSGAVGDSISIETAPLSTVVPSITSVTPTRTYNFDKVFGPEADQAMVFDQVVKNTLDEVMQGYNCTIFAYGQTGTGKTHTMQGDLVPSVLGAPSADAGIVPRTLHRLFSLLESSRAEYSVKISFVELYNEEIRDLLAHESHPHHGSAAGGSGGGQVGGLKIFEDPNPRGRGVLIQGLEECGVNQAKDGIELLRKGSARRETGETLMNKTSSRSHSIFSITVHIKESSATGEDLLKVGKFNLVDLAGSENIGRSGAEDKRAREAGMINQSLLTLGRVINALVDRGKHIPYRESKLTRLLQDSLGGHTKTRIIATISPSRTNLEETLSTLDYATRATKIMNKPEVNQRMTKGALIKEYVMEIERLKADLLASREKNGIFLSQESWSEITKDNELRRTQTEEAKSREIILEHKINNLTSELKDQMTLFLTTDSDLKMTRGELSIKVEELIQKERELLGVRDELDVERVVSGAFERGERKLDGVAGSLKSVAKASLGDLDGVFSKLDRKANVLHSNASSAAKFGTSTTQTTTSLSARLVEFQRSQESLTSTMSLSVEEFRDRNLVLLQTQLASLDSYLQSLAEGAAAVGGVIDDSTAERKAFTDVVQQARASIQASLNSWSAGLKEDLSSRTRSLREQTEEHLAEVGKPLGSAIETISRMIQDVRQHVQAEHEAISANQALFDRSVEEEMRRLSESDESVCELIDQQQLALVNFQTRISAVVADFQTAQSRQLSTARAQAQAVRERSEQRIRGIQLEHQQRSATAIGGGIDLEQRMTALEEVVAGITVEGTKTLAVASKQIGSGLLAVCDLASQSADQEMTKTRQHFNELSESAAESSKQALERQAQHQAALSSLIDSTKESYCDYSRDLGAMQDDVRGLTSALTASHETSSQHLADYGTSTSAALSSLHAATQRFLTAEIAEDVPTGTTPRKRVWDVQDSWERPRSRTDIIEKYHRARLAGGPLSPTFSIDEGDSSAAPLTLDLIAGDADVQDLGSSMGSYAGELPPMPRSRRRSDASAPTDSGPPSPASLASSVAFHAPSAVAAPPPPPAALPVDAPAPLPKQSLGLIPPGKLGRKASSTREKTSLAGEAFAESRINIPRTASGREMRRRG